MSIHFQSAFLGFATTSALLILEHILLYERLRPRGSDADMWRVLAKFAIGVAAILAGCAVIAWRVEDTRLFVSPLVCAAGGGVIALGYLLRWIVERIKATAYTRGRLHGLADRGDIGEDGRP